MRTHPSFTLHCERIVSDGEVLPDTHVRVAAGRIDAIGGPGISGPADLMVEAPDHTLLPGLIDAHVHLVPESTQLAALFGVTTILDMFSKPEVIDPERAATLEVGSGPARADLRTSSIGATAPNGHPTLAYAPLPYVTGPGDASTFVEARLAEGADHLKVIYDDGSGAMLGLPCLSPETIGALVVEAHRHALVVAAHVSTAAGAVTVARCGVDVLAHAPFDLMTPEQVHELAAAGVAVIATLSIVDGFPGPDGSMPLLTQSQLADRLPPLWRRLIERQAARWMPPQALDGSAQRANVLALHRAGVSILAGTDAPNPGLVPGASLHRELQHLVAAGLTPIEALSTATSAPARAFGLADRGLIATGTRADLVLVSGDPTTDIAATQAVSRVWIEGHPVDDRYRGSDAERQSVSWVQQQTATIVDAIAATWPDLPAPHDVVRDDGERLGRVVPTAGGWQPTTVFGAPLGEPTDHDHAVAVMHDRGLAVLAEPWWVRRLGDTAWQEAHLLEVSPDRVRLRWRDPLTEQPPAGQWVDLDDVDLVVERPS